MARLPYLDRRDLKDVPFHILFNQVNDPGNGGTARQNLAAPIQNVDLRVEDGAAVAAFDVFVIEHIMALLFHAGHHLARMPRVNAVVPRGRHEQRAGIDGAFGHTGGRGDLFHGLQDRPGGRT